MSSERQLLDLFPKLITDSNRANLLPILQDVPVVQVADLQRLSKFGEKLICIDKSMSIIEVFSSFLNPRVEHFIPEDGPTFFRDLITACLVLKKPDSFLANPVPFFINNFHRKEDYKETHRATSVAIRTTDEKHVVLDNLKTFLSEKRNTAKAWPKVVLIADELLMNAFFHAPVDSSHRPLHRHLPRSTSVRLKKDLRLFLAHDADRLIVGCEDPYGSLDRDALVKVLLRTCQVDKMAHQPDQPGSGLGCRMMIDQSMGFYAFCKATQKSLVFCVLDLGKSEIDMQNVPKSLHIGVW